MNPNAQRAGRELCDLLIYLRLAGRIISKMCCVIAWWANRAGAVGPCEALGKHPWAKSHHYQRHFDRQVNFAAQTRKQTILRVPGHAPHFNRRVVHPVSVVPPHEALRDEVAGGWTAMPMLREARHRRTLPPSYWSHSVVEALQPEPVWPLALYLDGLPFTKKMGCWHSCCATS